MQAYSHKNEHVAASLPVVAAHHYRHIGGTMTDTNAPSSAQEAVLVKSETLPEDTPVIKGYDFNNGIDYKTLLESYIHSGFQATTYGQAVEEVRRMVSEAPSAALVPSIGAAS